MVRDWLRAQLTPDRLPEGDTAPQWRLRDKDDAWHSQGEHWSLLVFHPGDDGPADDAQLTELQDHLGGLEPLSCRVFAISPSAKGILRERAARLGLTFPMLTDPGAQVCRTWRCVLEIPGPPRVIRTVYLVNPQGRIRLANRGSPSIEAIERSILALRQATRSGM